MGQAVEQKISPAAVADGARRSTERVDDCEDAAHENHLHAWQPPGIVPWWSPKTQQPRRWPGLLCLSLNLFSLKLHPRQPRGIHEAIILIGVGTHDWSAKDGTGAGAEVKQAVTQVVFDTHGVGDLLSVRGAQFTLRQPLHSHELVYGLDRAKFCRARALTHR